MSTRIYTPDELRKMTVPEIRALVRVHNLHFAIRGYSKLNKEPLIRAFIRYNDRSNEAPAAKRKPAPPARAAKKPTSARVEKKN